jgi:hypothetical protein
VSVSETIRRLTTQTLISLLMLLPSACGPRDEKRVEQPALSPDEVGRKALEEYDANKDGFLSADELERCPALKNSMELLDANKDGRLSGEEIAARVRKYQEWKLAILNAHCVVTLDGKPLPGATVSFVPENFMGTTTKRASATTDANGRVAPTIADAPTPGMNLGFYKIEVSLKDATGKETLPARYNSQTTLGQEVAPDVTGKAAVKLVLTSG